MSAAIASSSLVNANDNSNRTDVSEKNKMSSVKKKRDGNINSGTDTVIKVKSVIPRRRQELLKWWGWGYKDSRFEIVDEVASFTGDRYLLGGKTLPFFVPWVVQNLNIDVTKPPKTTKLPTSYPDSRLPSHVREELEAVALVSVEGLDRIIRAHGQTLSDMAQLRANTFPRIPDAVIWPECHEDVVKIVALATRHQFVIIPFGGGTSVSGSITCPAHEPRPIVALDTSEMNSILWIDRHQLLARVQTGIVGQDLEREMRARGLTVGHEPDSYEFSTLGGWVATRASGMKKNTYGNIEDLVVQTKTVTPTGVLEKGCCVPRISCGPEWEHVVMGSEGCFGVVTEVTIKVRPLPPVTRYGSLVFPAWEAGVAFEREVAEKRLQPSSIRLMDNDQSIQEIQNQTEVGVRQSDAKQGVPALLQQCKVQEEPPNTMESDEKRKAQEWIRNLTMFRFGLALKTPATWGGVVLDGLKQLYITRIKGFHPARLAVVTLLLEGEADAVAEREKRLNSIAGKYGGVPAGAINGERGYTFTFVIAYIRDLALDYSVVAESFETSVPWDRTLALCAGVKRRVRAECERRGVSHYHISCRLTQTYDAGCCIYFYFGFNSSAFKDPVAMYEEIEEAARDEIIDCGGSISHHHGVGKLRKKWYKDTVSEPGQRLLLAAKQTLDPDNIFALGNMAFGEDHKEEAVVKSKL